MERYENLPRPGSGLQGDRGQASRPTGQQPVQSKPPANRKFTILPRPGQGVAQAQSKDAPKKPASMPGKKENEGGGKPAKPLTIKHHAIARLGDDPGKLVLPIKNREGPYGSAEPSYAGGFPALFGGTQKGNLSNQETLNSEIGEESRTEYSRIKGRPLRFVDKKVVDNTEYNVWEVEVKKADKQSEALLRNATYNEMTHNVVIDVATLKSMVRAALKPPAAPAEGQSAPEGPAESTTRPRVAAQSPWKDTALVRDTVLRQLAIAAEASPKGEMSASVTKQCEQYLADDNVPMQTLAKALIAQFGNEDAKPVAEPETTSADKAEEAQTVEDKGKTESKKKAGEFLVLPWENDTDPKTTKRRGRKNR